MSNRSHITFVLDRTGSMEDIREDVIGGFNAFLAMQQDVQDETTFTLVQFDSVQPYELIHKVTPIGEVPPLTRETYVPRGGTPLFDAMGYGILALENRLSKLLEVERPDKVIFITVTDGHENQSREFDRTRVSRMIEIKKSNGWEFVFLSADMASFDDARSMGVNAGSSLKFSRSKRGNEAAWRAVSGKIKDRRTGVAESVVFDEVERKESDEE